MTREALQRRLRQVQSSDGALILYLTHAKASMASRGVTSMDVERTLRVGFVAEYQVRGEPKDRVGASCSARIPTGGW